jgi:hypothetical protein
LRSGSGKMMRIRIATLVIMHVVSVNFAFGIQILTVCMHRRVCLDCCTGAAGPAVHHPLVFRLPPVRQTQAEYLYTVQCSFLAVPDHLEQFTVSS